jgi:hypothetical protein
MRVVEHLLHKPNSLPQNRLADHLPILPQNSKLKGLALTQIINLKRRLTVLSECPPHLGALTLEPLQRRPVIVQINTRSFFELACTNLDEPIVKIFCPEMGVPDSRQDLDETVLHTDY